MSVEKIKRLEDKINKRLKWLGYDHFVSIEVRHDSNLYITIMDENGDYFTKHLISGNVPRKVFPFLVKKINEKEKIVDFESGVGKNQREVRKVLGLVDYAK